MDLNDALSTGQTAYLVKEGGTLDERTLTLFAIYEQDGERVVQRRRTEYKAMEPPRLLDPKPWWLPQGEERMQVDPADQPLDVEKSERWETTEADPGALDREDLDTAGKALNVLRGTDPDDAARKDPEPPFTEGFEIVKETAESKPGQSTTEVKEGPPEISSRRQVLEDLDN
jgi:hypothetical protein